MVRLDEANLSAIAADGRVPVPRYDRSRLVTGIVHVGVGGFHRAHEAMAVDRLLAQGRAEEFALPLATPLADLLEAVLAGGRVTVCSQCAARREIGPDDVLAGVRIAGAAVFSEEVLTEGVQALVY